MNVVVCIKQVPETPRIEIDPQTGALTKAEGKMIINPFDMYALEEGIRIKEQYEGKVTAISMGPPEAEEALREAIALGVDEAILLSDPVFEGSDTLATSYVLAKAVGKLGQPDIVICGRQTMDGDTGQVAPQLAEWLGIPFASYVSKTEEIREGHMTVQRMVDEGHQVIELPLPGVINVVKEINVPRLPSLRGLMQSKKVQIATWTAQELDVDMSKVGLAGSPTRVTRVFFPEKAGQGELLQGSPESQVDQLLEKLTQAKVI
ncbi:MAG: electron transfer flavoprotein subunit beta/FixA family protein [Dehalococcoidia bacterium]|nr:electron transfer flavoprotein subunit beta/FixA family protein [Dehalococcoidia bacterium]